MEENRLVEYMLKIQNMADFIARGYFVEDPDYNTTIELVCSDTVKERNAFSLVEYNLFDELDASFYGEQRSIGTLIRLINDGEYERQIEGKIDLLEPYDGQGEDLEFYNIAMKRVKQMIKVMFMSLISGVHIPVNSVEFYTLQNTYLDDDIEDESEIESIAESDGGYIIYNHETDKFYGVSNDGEIKIEDIDIEEAIECYNEWLEEKEQESLKKQLINEVIQKKDEIEEKEKNKKEKKEKQNLQEGEER